MGIIKKVLMVPREKYFIQHLSIINAMLPVSLTPKEVEVLGSFMALEGDIAEQDRFGTTPRKMVKERLNLSDGGIGNYIKSLKEKGFIYTDPEGKLKIHEVLSADNSNQSYLFKIVEE